MGWVEWGHVGVVLRFVSTFSFSTSEVRLGSVMGELGGGVSTEGGFLLVVIRRSIKVG